MISGAGSGISADGSCTMDDPHCSEMEAIHSLHKKLDDDANGNIDITESTGVSDKTEGCLRDLGI